MIIDKNISELLKLELNSKIRMTVHGSVQTYHFSDSPSQEEGFELYVENDNRQIKHTYGLSCNGLVEVVGVLIQDYANGIITDAKILKNDKKKMNLWLKLLIIVMTVTLGAFCLKLFAIPTMSWWFVFVVPIVYVLFYVVVFVAFILDLTKHS